MTYKRLRNVLTWKTTVHRVPPLSGIATHGSFNDCKIFSLIPDTTKARRIDLNLLCDYIHGQYCTNLNRIMIFIHNTVLITVTIHWLRHWVKYISIFISFKTHVILYTDIQQQQGKVILQLSNMCDRETDLNCYLIYSRSYITCCMTTALSQKAKQRPGGVS